MTEDRFDFFSININELDREWIEQPELYFKWARKIPEMQEEVEKAKSNLKVINAGVSRAIRRKPEKYGLEKVTEAAVVAAIPEHKDVIKATKRYNQAKYKLGVYTAAVSALDHRKKALENLVTLHGQHYFASPYTDNEIMKDAGGNATKKRIRDKAKKKRTKK